VVLTKVWYKRQNVKVIKNVFLSSLKAKEELSDMVLIVYGEELETMARKVRMSCKESGRRVDDNAAKVMVVFKSRELFLCRLRDRK
jgi:hypothetical protein